MPSTAESTSWEAERAELNEVLRSPLFARSPTLTHLLNYLCEKTFSGEADQIKEYSVALDVFERRDSFDQDTDSIVRVQANRLRKRLSEYYAGEGAGHCIHITIPVGQYVPAFQRLPRRENSAELQAPEPDAADFQPPWYRKPAALWLLVLVVLIGLTFSAVGFRQTQKPRSVAIASQPEPEPTVGLPVGDEVHILAGSSRKYVDHAGKLWSPDAFFHGGIAVSSSVQHIWRTQDPIIYRTSRQGDFTHDIPLKPGVYELHLHFAETLYGPESPEGGGEGSRVMNVSANAKALLQNFDVLADAGEGRTAEAKVFPDMSPASDGLLHLSFSSGRSGAAMVSAIEILPGIPHQLRPIRVVTRDVPYYSNDSRWWSPDSYFKGGQLSSSPEAAEGTDDPEFYETERWGHFSYAIPVARGRYTVTLHFIAHRESPANSNSTSSAGKDQSFNVFCNGKVVLSKLNLIEQSGEDHPLVRKIRGLEPNAQGKLLLEFVPVTRYATVTAIEVVGE